MRQINWIILAVAFLAFPSPSPAGHLDCVVSDPNPPLNVRSDDLKTVVGRLQNGERIFAVYPRYPLWEDADKWVDAFRLAGGAMRKLGVVFRAKLSCPEKDTSQKYPYILADRAQLRSFGLTLDGYGGGRNAEPYPNKCFGYGDGGYPMTLSDELIARHKGISFETLCFVLRQGGLRYDPSSGRRLPTYILANIKALRSGDPRQLFNSVTEELPLEVPSCFKQGAVVQDEASASFIANGCSFEYDTSSGRRLSAEESAYFKKAGLALDGGSGTGTPAEESRTAVSRPPWVTPAQTDTRHGR
jgi:hypothetical protein